MARPHNSPDVFRAVGHHVRRRMLEMLKKRAMTTSELAQPFNMSTSTISEHLRTLRAAGLIAFRIRKNQHLYSLQKSQLRSIRRWIDQFPGL